MACVLQWCLLARQVAFVDAHGHLHLQHAHELASPARRLHMHVRGIAWHDEVDILVALSHSSLVCVLAAVS